MSCKKSILKKSFPFAVAVFLLGSALSAGACTDVVVGKKASVDGSVITSHSADGGLYDSNVHVIPGKTFKKGAMADVFLNITGDNPGGLVKIGEIPQVEATYSYFHVGYPFMNEYGVSIGETTLGQKEELKTFRPDARAIMTIEQLEVFALQRTKTAREAIQVIGSLAEKYGFIGSCVNEGECLTITDSNEAWVLEMHSVGFTWLPESGKPGAIWVAQRVPDDEVVVVPNMSRIREVNPKDKDNFMVSKAYKQLAIDMGWYDPESGEPFIWQEAYSPLTGGWSLSSMWVRNRLYKLYTLLAPSQEWDPNAETMSYPFSIKPEKKVSVQDVMAMLGSHMEESPFDMEAAESWMVRDGEKSVKSPLATPFATMDLCKLINMPYHRPVSKCAAYTFVSQSRSGMPKGLNTVLWFGYDNPYTTFYVPIYCGVEQIRESWRNCDWNAFSLDSAQWAFILAEELVNHRFQDADKDLKAVRGPLEKKFFDRQADVEKKAQALFKKDPAKGMAYLTEYTDSCMEEAENACWKLDWTLITKYNNNKIH